MAGIKPNNRSSPGPIGNTQGIIVPKTSPNASGPGNSAPPPKPEPKEAGWWKRWGSDLTHNALDVVGLIPMVGEVCDGANALVYAAEGDMVNAALSAAAMLPVGGQAATAGKWAVKGIKKIEKEAVKEVEEAAAKKLAKEAEEAAAKKAAKEAEEKAAKEAEEKAAKGGHVEGNKSDDIKNYKDTFFKKNPDLKGKVVVHHGVEQQVLKRPETGKLLTESEIHSYENLRGIPKEVNSNLHLSTIRKEWNKFYRDNPFPTKQDLLNKRNEIDKMFGHRTYAKYIFSGI